MDPPLITIFILLFAIKIAKQYASKFPYKTSLQKEDKARDSKIMKKNARRGIRKSKDKFAMQKQVYNLLVLQNFTTARKNGHIISTY